MNKADLFFGFLIGLAAAFVGSYFFIVLFTKYDFLTGLEIMKSEGQTGKIITLGAVMNLIVFFLLLQFKRELMARGVVLATIVLTIITLLV